MIGSLQVTGIGKSFKRYDGQRAGTLKELLMRGLRQPAAMDRFWAQHQISFAVESGRMLGIIGHNGSGKSTLLRMIGGLMRPDVGHIKTNGRVSGLLQLNAGVHSELTGRENILIGGVVAGLTKREVMARFDEIVKFAELEAFIDNPVRTYSAGMLMRLGFAVAISTDPGVMLIDEVLSVGDIAFQAKCLQRIRRIKDEGCAIVLVTHDLSQAENLCDEVLWLRRGEIAAYGSPQDVVSRYKAEMAHQTRGRTPAEVPDVLLPSGITLQAHRNRFGSLELQISRVRVLDPEGDVTTEIETGSSIAIEVSFEGSVDGISPILGISIGSEDGRNYIDLNTAADRVTLPKGNISTSVTLRLDRLDLSAGRYLVSAGLYHPNWDYAYDYHWLAYPFVVNSAVHTTGALSPPHRWTIGIR